MRPYLYMTYTSKALCKYPTKARWRYTDADLEASAAPFKHRSAWKQACKAHYDAAWRRGILDRCCAHMTPMASPYGKDYEIYAYEFTDRRVYVGLTFLPRARALMHQVRGPVADHAKVCSTFTRAVCATGLTREQAPEEERSAIARYQKEGWVLLNRNSGGSTGTVRGRKWTKETVLAEARKHRTRQAWLDSSQASYRVAKREGWFAEAAAHMPRRVLGIGVGRKVSASTRAKQSAAKTGVLQSSATRQARSEALKRWWASQRKP